MVIPQSPSSGTIVEQVCYFCGRVRKLVQHLSREYLMSREVPLYFCEVKNLL